MSFQVGDKVVVVRGYKFDFSDNGRNVDLVEGMISTVQEVTSVPTINVEGNPHYWRSDRFVKFDPKAIVDRLRNAIDTARAAGYTVGPVEVTPPPTPSETVVL